MNKITLNLDNIGTSNDVHYQYHIDRIDAHSHKDYNLLLVLPQTAISDGHLFETKKIFRIFRK